MKYFLILIAYSTILSVQAQNNITGLIVNDKQEPIDLALVALMDLKDSSYVATSYSDVDGSYSLSKVAEGKYNLVVSLLGYKSSSHEIVISTTDLSFETIVLKEDAQQLDAVTITAKIPFIERKIDRTILNPEALISNAGSNALEVLEKAPGILVDSDGSIMLKGRSGVSIFINDKPSYLSGSDLESYLRSLPAGAIKQIEIMTNPPAKYEAAGNAGVINIITKRNKLLGLHGNTSLGFRQGIYSNSNNSLNLNINKNKWSLYSNTYAGFYNTLQDLNINRYTKDDSGLLSSSFEQNSINRRQGKYLNSKLGVDYYLSDKTAIGLSYQNRMSPTDRLVDNTAEVRTATGALFQSVVADNDSDVHFNSAVYNAYLTHKIDSMGGNISFDADYVEYNSGNDQVFQNFIYLPNDSLDFKDQINGEIPSTIKIYALKSDLTKALSAKSKIEAGIKSARTKTENEAIYSTTIGTVTSPNYGLSNNFLYDEWINAAYLNYSTRIGRFDLQAGLRAENTKFTGEQLGNIETRDTSFTRSYTSLFPTFYISTRLDSSGNNTLNFNYGKRVERPYFQDLNPFISPLDKFTFYSGNPDLLPTFSHNFSLSHSYKSIINTSFNFSITEDEINETLEIREAIYYSRPGNIANSKSYSLSIDGSIPIAKWYNLNTYFELGHLVYDSPLYSQQLNSNGTYYYLSATNGFQLGKEWSADLTAIYRDDIVVAQLVVRGYYQINLGLQKKIFDGRGNLKLSVDDIFKSRIGAGIINNLENTDADWNSTFDSRRASLTFSYRFGKSTSNKKKYNSSGSSGEQRRVKG